MTFNSLCYTLGKDKLKIFDSYLISKYEFLSVLNYIKNCDDGNPKDIFSFRTEQSMVDEWTCHNFLYNLNIKRERTQDVDLEYPQKPIIKFLYQVGGKLVWLFIN